MNHHFRYDQIAGRLTQAGIPYGCLELQDGIRILIVERGGRILGPFLPDHDESIYWCTGALADAEQFDAFLARGDWNLGGDRLWIGPEVQYLVQRRGSAPGESQIAIPSAMDPGAFRLQQVGPARWHLSQRMTLQAYHLALGQKELRLECLIAPAANPLATLRAGAQLMDGVRFAGYRQRITLAEEHSDTIMSFVWNLIQVHPGGVVFTPCTPQCEVTDYGPPVEPAYHSLHAHYFSARITGDHKYKVGYSAAHLMGRLGYLNRLTADSDYLLVRTFFNNPSAPHIDEPAHLPGQNGASVFIYNDAGRLGGFGEMECVGQTIGGATGESSAPDCMLLWLFVGPADKVRAIAQHLLGIAP